MIKIVIIVAMAIVYGEGWLKDGLIYVQRNFHASKEILGKRQSNDSRFEALCIEKDALWTNWG